MYEEEPKLKRRYSALLLILALLLGCLGGCASDKAAVTAAVGNSLKAYAAAFTSLVPQETFDREEGYRQDGDILLTALPDDYAFLEGAVRLRFAAASAKEGAPVEAEYSLELATMTLLTLSMRIENALTYLNCPQLLGEEWLGVAPETLPEDLERLGLGELELPDLAGLAAAAPGSQFELTDGEEDALEAAGKSVLAGLQVKRSGKESRDINVQPLDCQLYTVTLPAETVMVCFDALRAPLQRAMEENALSAAPGDGEEGETATPQEQLDALREAVDSLGDVSLTLGVAGQKVALAESELKGSYRGESFALYPSISLGGGENYVDDLGLVLRWGEAGDDEQLALRSHGDHAAAGGSFTDESRLTLPGDGNSILLKAAYTPGGGKDNLKLELDAGGNGMTLAGGFRSSETELALEDCLVTLTTREGEELGAAVNFRLHGYEELTPRPDAPLLLSEISQEKLAELVEAAVNRAGILMALLSGV